MKLARYSLYRTHQPTRDQESRTRTGTPRTLKSSVLCRNWRRRYYRFRCRRQQ
jgi:hypothetical protein